MNEVSSDQLRKRMGRYCEPISTGTHPATLITHTDVIWSRGNSPENWTQRDVAVIIARTEWEQLIRNHPDLAPADVPTFRESKARIALTRDVLTPAKDLGRHTHIAAPVSAHVANTGPYHWSVTIVPVNWYRTIGAR